MKTSAGILLYRETAAGVMVLLVHPGGPFWSNRDDGAWSLPKGESSPGEPPESAALREFAEETGRMPEGTLQPLGELRQSSAKLVTAFAVKGDFNVSDLRSNLFETEWPPRSGRRQSFPEVDRAAWFTLPEAHRKIVAGQRPFLDRLDKLREVRT